MNTREQAIQWWNDLTQSQRIGFGIKYNYTDRFISSLTGSEIEGIWQKEDKSPKNIYYDRLKEQYYEVARSGVEKQKDYRRIRYRAMREFCLDTQLLDFNTIEVMESEVNSSF